jgi:transposase
MDGQAAQLTACLRRVSDEGQLTTELVDCGATSRERVAFRHGWQANQWPVGALERTGVSWKPGYHGLSETVEVWVATSRDGRQRPGNKTDTSDATWIAERLAHGLITPRWVPAPAMRA